MKMNGRQRETVGLTGISTFIEPHQISPDLPIGEPVPERDLSSPPADTPTRRHADTFPLS